MSIININVIIKISGSKERVEIIQAALDPDNLTAPPMVFHSVCVAESLIYTIKNVKNIETMLATLMDLLSALQATEGVLRLQSNL
ncbi:MAG: hypothetical protein ACFFB5_17595 [Promethearchaeota archaeon]